MTNRRGITAAFPSYSNQTGIMYPIFYSNCAPYKSIILHRALLPYRSGSSSSGDRACSCQMTIGSKSSQGASRSKKSRLLTILALMAFLSFPSPATAQVVPGLGLQVESKGKTDYGAARSESKTQVRTVSATVSNTGKSDMSSVEVRWAIYGKTMDGNKLVEITSGAETKNVPAGASIVFESREVSISGAREHAVASGGGRRKRYKDVPASGERYYGYAVEVFIGGKMVLSRYEQPSIKNLRQNVP